MPELPEVETVVRGLYRSILNKKISQINYCAPHLKRQNPRGFEKKISGHTITAVKRIGKNIFINLDDHSFVHVHLRMTGQFKFLKLKQQRDKHDHVAVKFVKSNSVLIYRDVRKFGVFRYVPSSQASKYMLNLKLGCDALIINQDDFVDLLKSKARMIKPLLLDQSVIAGLGNIYVDEILFLTRIHPKRLSSSISAKKLRQMHAQMLSILQFSIDNMGTTIDSFSQVNSQPGQFQAYLKVYDRAGELCTVCGKSKIRRIVVAQRGTHICPTCQKAPR